ncbi:MAG TPA: hypothetical protein VMU39_02750 [Solirubrobacteraceae bacterium]|nr:hypothetical protein [Solirubrobacteraceae bacterium]
MSSPRVRGVRTAILAGVLSLSVSASANAYIYWPGSGSGVVQPGQALAGLESANLDASNVQPVPGTPQFEYVVSDGTYLYGSGGFDAKIGRVGVGGTGLNSAFVTAATPSCGSFPQTPSVSSVAVDGSHIFWTDIANGTIGRAGIDGSAPNDQFLAVYRPCGPGGFGLNQGPGGLAVAGGRVYWSDTDDGKVGRANVDGTGVSAAFISGATYPTSVAASGTDVYWSNNPITGGGWTIGHAHLDATGAVIPASVSQSFITGVGNNAALAVFGGFLYFDDNDGWIGRSTLDGSSIIRHFVQDGESGSLGGPIAVDAGQSSPTTTSAACGASSLDVIEEPVDGTALNMLPGTICTVTVRDSSAAPRPVGGTVTFTVSPIEGKWDTPKGSSEGPSAGCQLVPSSTPGLSSCKIGYHTNPDATGFVHGARLLTLSASYGGESAHNASSAGAVTIPLRIVHNCGVGPGDAAFIVCDANGNVVNGASNWLLPSFASRLKTFKLGFGVATVWVPTCLLAGRRNPARLVFATTSTAPTVVQRVLFAVGRGRSVTAKHNPFTVELKFPAGRHHAKVTLVATLVVTAPHRTTKTIRWPLRLC